MTDKVDEQAPSGAQRYYMHAQAHDQAVQKYAISSKSVAPDQAKTHRKLGRLHKQISAALNQIAGLHTSSDFSRALQKRQQTMANKKVNEMADEIDTEIEDVNTDVNDNEDTVTEQEDVIEIDVLDEQLEDAFVAILDEKPSDFAATFGEMLKARAFDRIEDMKVGLAQVTFNDVDDVQEGEEEDVENIDELHGKGSLEGIQAHHKRKQKMHTDVSHAYGNHGDHDDHALDKSMEHGMDADRHETRVARAGALIRQRDHHQNLKAAKASYARTKALARDAKRNQF